VVDNVTAVSGAVSLPDNTTIATDNIGGVNYQRVKLTWGADGTATDVSSGTAALPIAVSTSTLVIGAVLPSSQWTVSVTPSSQFTVTSSLTSSTAVFGAVMPSTQWTVTTTPSSQMTVSVTPSSQFTVTSALTSSTAVIGSVLNASSTAIFGAVMPSTQWTVTTTPSSQISVTSSITTSTTVIGATMASSQWTVANASSTAIFGAVMPSTQWTVSVTPTTQFTVTTTPSSQMTVSTTPTSAYSVNATQVTTSWTINPNLKTTQGLTNASIIATSTAVGFPNILAPLTASQTIRVFRLGISTLTACRFQIAASTTTSTSCLAEFCLPANGFIYLDGTDGGEPLFVSNSGAAIGLGQNGSAAAAIITGFIQYTKS